MNNYILTFGRLNCYVLIEDLVCATHRQKHVICSTRCKFMCAQMFGLYFSM